MSHKVKIVFMDKSGNISDDPEGYPVIPIYIQPASTDNPQKKADGSQPTLVYALVDTGADLFYMDDQLAENLGFHGTEPVTIQGGTSTLESHQLPSIFSVEGIPGLYAAQFASTPLTSNERAYKIVIGMRFLRIGCLVMDFQKGVFEFSIDT